MTRQHFEAIAAAIDAAKDDEGHCEQMRLDVAMNIARAMKRFNPNFNMSRFIEACGL